MFMFRQVLNLPRTMEPASAHWIGSRETPHGGAARRGRCATMHACQEDLGDSIAPGSSSSGKGTSDSPWRCEACVVGYDVVGYDTDELRTKKLNVGESFIEDITARTCSPQWRRAGTAHPPRVVRAQGSMWPSSRCRHP